MSKNFENYLQGILKKETIVYYDYPFKNEGYLQAIITPSGYYYLDNKKFKVDSRYKSSSVKSSYVKGINIFSTYICEVFPLKLLVKY